MKKATQLLSRRSPDHFVLDHFEAQRDGELDAKALARFERDLASSVSARKWVAQQQDLIYQLQLDAVPQFSLTQAARLDIQGNIYNRLRHGNGWSVRRVVFIGICLLLIFGFGIGIGSDGPATSYVISYPSNPMVIEIAPPQAPLLLNEGIASEVSFTEYALVNGAVGGFFQQMMVDDNGHVWLSQRDGSLFQFNGQIWRSFDFEDAIWDEALNPIEHVSDNALWLGGVGYGIARFDGNAWQSIPFSEGYFGDRISGATTSSSGDIWLGMADGLLRYDGFSWQFYNIHSGIPVGDIHELVATSSNEVWFTSYQSEGLARFDGSTTEWFQLPEGYSASNVHTMVLAPDDTIWLATPEGLLQFDGQNWQSTLILDGIVDNDTQLITFDDLGQMWVSTRSGLWRYDGSDWAPILNSVNSSADILAISSDGNGSVWVLTENGLLNFGAGLAPEPIEPVPAHEGIEDGS